MGVTFSYFPSYGGEYNRIDLKLDYVIGLLRVASKCADPFKGIIAAVDGESTLLLKVEFVTSKSVKVTNPNREWVYERFRTNEDAVKYTELVLAQVNTTGKVTKDDMIRLSQQVTSIETHQSTEEVATEELTQSEETKQVEEAKQMLEETNEQKGTGRLIRRRTTNIVDEWFEGSHVVDEGEETCIKKAKDAKKKLKRKAKKKLKKQKDKVCVKQLSRSEVGQEIAEKETVDEETTAQATTTEAAMEEVNTEEETSTDLVTAESVMEKADSSSSPELTLVPKEEVPTLEVEKVGRLTKTWNFLNKPLTFSSDK